jgi:hypothetical protein
MSMSVGYAQPWVDSSQWRGVHVVCASLCESVHFRLGGIRVPPQRASDSSAMRSVAFG